MKTTGILLMIFSVISVITACIILEVRSQKKLAGITTTSETEEALPDGSVMVLKTMNRSSDTTAEILCEQLADSILFVAIGFVIFFVGLLFVIIGLLKKKKQDKEKYETK